MEHDQNYTAWFELKLSFGQVPKRTTLAGCCNTAVNFKPCNRIQWPFLLLCLEQCSFHLLQNPRFSQPQGHSLDENDISKELISSKKHCQQDYWENKQWKISFWLFNTLNSKGTINNELIKKCYNFWWWEIMGNLLILFLFMLGKNNLE